MWTWAFPLMSTCLWGNTALACYVEDGSMINMNPRVNICRESLKVSLNPFLQPKRDIYFFTWEWKENAFHTCIKRGTPVTMPGLLQLILLASHIHTNNTFPSICTVQKGSPCTYAKSIAPCCQYNIVPIIHNKSQHCGMDGIFSTETVAFLEKKRIQFYWGKALHQSQ